MCINHSEEIMQIQKNRITSNSELISILSKYEETTFSKFMLDVSMCFSKSAEKSLQFKQEGNRLFASKQNNIALEAYNKAVSHAPQSEHFKGEELSLALANRSAVLYQMKLFR